MLNYAFQIGIASGLLSLVLCGCAKRLETPTRATTYPVSGSLLINGSPAIRAAITFHPAAPAADGKAHGPAAHTDDNGGFRLTTFSAYDGAPPGDYRVTVVANWVSQSGQDVEVPDLLKGKFSDPAKSPLRITVREGENELEQFDLKSD